MTINKGEKIMMNMLLIYQPNFDYKFFIGCVVNDICFSGRLKV